MKGFFYILTFFCLLSCTKPTDVISLLEQAEGVMNAHPDSALTLLESISEPEELSQKDKALWGLLLTQARDKNYVPHTSDSLITRSIDYFRTHNDTRRLAWAYYYDGMIHYELEEFELSQTALFNAEETAKQIKDFALLGKVYEKLSSVYWKQNYMDLILPTDRKALEAKLKTGDSLEIAFAYGALGYDYVEINLDSAAYHYQRALSWLQSNPLQQYMLLWNIGVAYKMKKNYKQANILFQQALLIPETYRKSVNHLYLNLAETYTALGQPDSAIYYLKYCLNDPGTRTAAHKDLSNVYRSLGDYEKAHVYMDQHVVYLDSFLRGEKAIALSVQLKKHEKKMDIVQKEKQEKEAVIARLEKEQMETRFFYLVVGTVMIVSLLSVALVLIEKNRRRKSELLRMSNEVAVAQQKYLQMMAREENMENLRRYCLKDSSIYSQLVPLMGKKRELKDFKLMVSEEQDWENFYHQLDFVYANFVTRLKDQYRLKEEHLKLACMSLLNVQPCNAKNIFHQTGAAVTNKRNALAEKLGVSLDELDSFLRTFSEANK